MKPRVMEIAVTTQSDFHVGAGLRHHRRPLLAGGLLSTFAAVDILRWTLRCFHPNSHVYGAVVGA